MRSRLLACIVMPVFLTFSVFAQEETNPSIGIQYKHFPNAAKSGANSSIGVNIIGNIYPENFTTIDYDARIGAVTAGNVDGKKYVDVDLDLGVSQVLIFRGAYQNNPNLHSAGGVLGMGFGHGDEPMGSGGFIGVGIYLGRDFRNTFIENNIGDMDYNVTSYTQKGQDIIVSETELSPEQIVNLNPDSFDKTVETRKFDSSSLKNISGSNISFFGTQIPLNKGALSFSGKLRFLESETEDNQENSLSFKTATGVKKVDVGGGILVDKNYYVYSEGSGKLTNQNISASYKRVDISLQLAYSKAKVRIWVEPSYTQNNLEIVKDALNLKSVTQKNLGITVGLNYHIFKYKY